MVVGSLNLVIFHHFLTELVGSLIRTSTVGT
jgi:hypothetical protein